MTAPWKAVQRLDGIVPTVAEPQLSETKSDRITITRALDAFSSEFGQYAALHTQKKYRLILKKLRAHSDGKGYVLIEQWTRMDVREFRASWNVAHQTAAKDMSLVKSFFEFCLSNEWIARNPARSVRNQRGREAGDRRGEQKLPFTDVELDRMYEACEKSYGKQEVKWSRDHHGHRATGEYVRYNFKWTGQDMADFISISGYTGLRISDVSTFHIDRL